MMLKQWLGAGILLFLYLSTMGLYSPSAVDKPLPDVNVFLQEIKQRMARYDDRELLRDYTYRMKSIQENLTKDNTVKDTEIHEYEVYYAKERPYRKLIRKNGAPLSAKELKKQDDEQAEKERKIAQREAKTSERERQAKAEQRRKERQQSIDDLFNAYQFQILRREILHGRPAIVLAFTPRKEAKLHSQIGKMALKKMTGKAWIEENEHELIKAEMEVIDSLTFGAGLLAKVNKGTEFNVERRKINNEIWLPAKMEVRLKARLALVKGLNMRRVEEYSDYKKFTVSSDVTFPGGASGEKK